MVASTYRPAEGGRPICAQQRFIQNICNYTWCFLLTILKRQICCGRYWFEWLFCWISNFENCCGRYRPEQFGAIDIDMNNVWSFLFSEWDPEELKCYQTLSESYCKIWIILSKCFRHWLYGLIRLLRNFMYFFSSYFRY